MAAEELIQLPARDTRNIDKAQKQHAEDVRKGRELRGEDRADTHVRDRWSTTGRAEE
jgi:membrane protein